MKKNLFLVALISAIPHFSFAVDLTVTSKATATLVSSCVLSTNNVSFGDITPTSSTLGWDADPATGNLSVVCSNNLSFTIDLNLGQYFNSTSGRRNMNGSSSNDRVGYIICQSSTFNTSTALCDKAWWSSGGTRNNLSSKGTGFQQNIPVYGFVLKNYYTPDNYSDTLTATLTY